MKVGTIAQPNEKWQVVIPKEIRDTLNIREVTPFSVTVQGRGIYLSPIATVLTHDEQETSYALLLKKTKGAWGKELKGIEKKKKSMELAASRKRKLAW